MKIKTPYSLFLTLLFITIVIGFLPVGKFNLIVQLIFVLIGIISVCGIFFTKKKGEGYSLNTVYWLFNYTFFFIAPLTQFKYQIVFQSDIIIDDFLYIKSGLTVLIASLVYFLCYKFCYKMIKPKDVKFKIKFNYLLLLYLSIVTSLLFLYLIKFNLDVILFRPPSGWLKQNVLYGNLGYAITSIVRYVPFFCLLIYKLTNKNNDKLILILLSITLIITFPISLSRGILAALYMPLLVLFFPTFKKKYYFLGLFLVAIIIVFPLGNGFRNITTNGFVFNYELFNSPQLDAFQNFMLLLNEKIVTNGAQLVDSIFFLNENIKGSGQILGEQLGFNFFNIAMPFLGEGYINFGYFGVFLFVLIIASFNAFLDRRKNNLPIFFKSIYFILIGFEFYILRGDLSSSIKKMLGFILALFIVTSTHYIYKKIFKLKNS